MKTVSILPFAIDVEMITYQSQAFPLGIIKANMKNYDIWLCDKLILNRYNADKPSLLFDTNDEDLLSLCDGFISAQSLSTATLRDFCKSRELINYNRMMIDQGYYISGGVDDFYIPQKSSFNKYHFDHDYVLFGYNDFMSVFYSAGYLEDGRYNFFNITYDDYLQGVINHKSSDIYINYHKTNNAYQPKINIPLIKYKLQEYLNPFHLSQPDATNVKYGTAAWMMLAEYVNTNKDTLLDIRYGRLFMEHRYVMLQRIRVLKEIGVIENEKEISDYHAHVYMRAKAVFLLFIKQNSCPRADIPIKISQMIFEIVQAESEIINRVIGSINI